MSRENAALLREGIEALNRADIEALAENMHPQAEWRPALTAGGDLERPVYRGPAGMSDYLKDLKAAFATTQFQIESLEPLDSHRVFFRGRVTAEGRASGVQLDVPIWAIWEFRDGWIIRGTAFLNEPEALEAVGLRE